MTKISLRVYNREIEAMVESGQVDEALAHCQNILKTFPMHLETYRILGKAYLETRRYGDAADIFQRVLMSVPEDFVSHVGMSIIRDDENKLDAAIWHMERAFEVQPSNPAIQDELRKLYGRRDGVQPPKVRLTRDALANMYAQGALYSQAIAEIRAVLADDPNRPDLQVMLARAYSKDGRKNQAIELCTELIKKYPYCFDALRILIDLMPPNDTQDFTQPYRLRVSALDPYAGFVNGSMFNSDNVPDNAVNLELLDYDPNNMDGGSQPAWASSLGINLEPDKGQQDVPEWLSEKVAEIKSVSDEVIQPTSLDEEKEENSEVDVPDWMRSSGWEKNTDQIVENTNLDDLEFENDEPLAKAEIPEWLKEMAPDEELPEPEKLPDGFESMLEGNSINSLSQDNIKDIEQEPDFIEDVLENAKSGEEIPDWMKDGEQNEPIQAETESPEISNKMEPEQDVFTTISSQKSQEQSIEASGQPVDDISSWLGEVKGNAIDGEKELYEFKNNEDDLPDWLKDIGSDEPIDALDKTNEPTAEIPNQPVVYSSTLDQIDPDMETSSEEDLPEWLKAVGSEKLVGNLEITNEPTAEILNQSEVYSSTLDQVDPDMEASPEEDLPGWLNDVGSEKPLGDIEITVEPIAEILNQSEEFSSDVDKTDPKLEASPEEDLPDWLKDVGSEKPLGDIEITVEPTAEILNQSEEYPSTLDQVDPDMEASPEEDLPGWLNDVGSEKPLGDFDITNEPTTEILNQSEVYSSAIDQIDPNMEAVSEDEPPDWLKEIDSGQEIISPDDELFSTLRVEEEVSSQADDEKDTSNIFEPLIEPEGLRFGEEFQIPTPEDTKPKIEPVRDRLPLMDDQEAAMAWLENLAARQGAKSEELLTRPEDRLEELPEWVKKSIEDELETVDEEAIISSSSEPEVTELTGRDEQSLTFEANEEGSVKGKVFSSPDFVDFPEAANRDETIDPFEFDKSAPDIQPSSLVEKLSSEKDQHDGFSLNQDHADSPEFEMASSSDTNISKYLTELEANYVDNPQDLITPKISEYYGSEISEPLPDWLKEVEKDSSESEWISESEDLPEQNFETNGTELKPEEKDIDDIREIFPTDSSNWNFEDSESETGLGPIGDVVKPVTSGEWQPIQPEQNIPAEEISDISITDSADLDHVSSKPSKPSGSGMLSKIPAKDNEKEAETLERAQSFIESGEIKKALEIYARLVKKGRLLEGVIHDLRESTYRYPIEIGIWQLLGDAYMRANRLQDALDAYTKAEELFR